MNAIDVIIDYLATHPKLMGHSDFSVVRHGNGAIMTWAEPVENRKLKVQCLHYMLTIQDDRAVLHICDFPIGTYLFADPAFPGNLLRAIHLPKPRI